MCFYQRTYPSWISYGNPLSPDFLFPAWKARITSAHLHLVCVVSLTPTTGPTCHRCLLNENHEGEKKQWIRTVGQSGVKSCRPRGPKSQESKPDTVGDHKTHLMKRRRAHESQGKLSRACSYEQGFTLTHPPGAGLSVPFSESSLGLKVGSCVQRFPILDGFSSVRLFLSQISKYTVLREGVC